MAYKTIVEDNIDILVAGAGLGGCGAAFEARFWGQNKKIVIAEKANIDRSGAVAQGLYAINCYMGTRWGENNPEDHVKYARIDLMGMVREDLLFDMARHCGLHRPPVRRVGPAADEESGNGPIHARRALADHDSWRILQTHRRRSGEEIGR